MDQKIKVLALISLVIAVSIAASKVLIVQSTAKAKTKKFIQNVNLKD
jgi:hypothetical protein